MRETQNPCSHGAYVLMGEVLSKQILIIQYIIHMVRHAVKRIKQVEEIRNVSRACSWN